MIHTITLLISCKDRKGIIANTTNFILEQEGNIVYVDQHVDREQEIFFMRIESEFSDSAFNLNSLKTAFENSIVKEFGMKWRIYTSTEKIKMALFVKLKIPQKYFLYE